MTTRSKMKRFFGASHAYWLIYLYLLLIVHHTCMQESYTVNHGSSKQALTKTIKPLKKVVCSLYPNLLYGLTPHPVCHLFQTGPKKTVRTRLSNSMSSNHYISEINGLLVLIPAIPLHFPEFVLEGTHWCLKSVDKTKTVFDRKMSMIFLCPLVLFGNLI